MIRRKIIFVAHPFICGGVEKSMLSAMSLIDLTRYQVTLLLVKKQSEMLSYVPPTVDICEIPFLPLDRFEIEYGRKVAFRYAFTHFHWIHCFTMLWTKVNWFLHGRHDNYYEQIIASMVNRIRHVNGAFKSDFAFAYSGGIFVGALVKWLIDAPVKAIWCHGEGQMSMVASTVSDSVYKAFTHRYATLDLATRLNAMIKSDDKKFEVMPYYLDVKSFNAMADNGVGLGAQKCLKILTVGRLTHQKGIDYAINIAARLKVSGVNFCWYVIGEGEDRNLLEKMIKEKNVSDCFVLLGLKMNPYPFIKTCDIYAQPSRWEAYCIAVAEARAFCKPIICTDFVGAKEQLHNGETGVIVPLDDMNAFYEKLRQLIGNEMLRMRLCKALSKQSDATAQTAFIAWKNVLEDAI